MFGPVDPQPQPPQPHHPENAAVPAIVAAAIHAFQEGDNRHESFSVLVEIYYRPVLRFLARWIPLDQDRLDVAQETFLRAFRGLKRFRGESQFDTWLFQIAHHTYLRWLRRHRTSQPTLARRRGRDVEEEDCEAATSDGSPIVGEQFDALLRKERSQKLHEAMESLPAQMRRCVELRVHHDLRYREIAAVLQLSVETVKVHLFQARKRLKERLQGDNP
jgi:RNA polymerase sigma-70 factor (ECF subfamily)